MSAMAFSIRLVDPARAADLLPNADINPASDLCCIAAVAVWVRSGRSDLAWRRPRRAEPGHSRQRVLVPENAAAEVRSPVEAAEVDGRLGHQGCQSGDEIDRHEALYYMARQLLRDTSLPAPKIADMLGYADGPTFTRAFHRWSGTTPAIWRNVHKRA